MKQKKWKKGYKVFIISIGIAILTYSLLMLSLFLYGSEKVINTTSEIDYVLILGARVTDEGPTKTLKLRLDTAVDYIMENELTIPIIVSGGQGADEPVSEAEAMYQYLVERGIPSQQIIKETQSTTTAENIRYSKELLKNGNHVLLVTNDFHIARATYLAARNGLTVSRLPAPNAPQSWLFNLAREPLAFFKTLLFD